MTKCPDLDRARRRSDPTCTASGPWARPRRSCPRFGKPLLLPPRPERSDHTSHPSRADDRGRCPLYVRAQLDTVGLSWTQWDLVRSKATARETGKIQLTGYFRRWWQVLGSNQRRLSRRFYSTLLSASKYGLDLHEFRQAPSCGATLSAICPCPRTRIRRSMRTATDTVRATRLTCPDLSAGLLPGPSRPRQSGRPAVASRHRDTPSPTSSKPGTRSPAQRHQLAPA
jgi:hypothetical protein